MRTRSASRRRARQGGCRAGASGGRRNRAEASSTASACAERARKPQVALEVLPRERERPVVVEVREDLDAAPPLRDPALPRRELRVGVVAGAAMAAVEA